MIFFTNLKVKYSVFHLCVNAGLFLRNSLLLGVQSVRIVSVDNGDGFYYLNGCLGAVTPGSPCCLFSSSRGQSCKLSSPGPEYLWEGLLKSLRLFENYFVLWTVFYESVKNSKSLK